MREHEEPARVHHLEAVSYKSERLCFKKRDLRHSVEERSPGELISQNLIHQA